MSQVAVMDSRPSRAVESKRTLDMAASLLAKGETHLEKHQFTDAVDCFDLALCLDPTNQQAQLGLNRAHCQIVPRWHFEMLNDEQRNAAFQRALTNLITPETIVLDIGSGTGLLAMMAAQAGAKEIITCEMVPQLAELTRDTITLNGLSDRIVTVDKKSTSLVLGVQMVHKANLLVTETVDCGLLGEGIVVSIAHAKANLLTDDARIVPCASTVYAMVVESPRLRNLNFANGTIVPERKTIEVRAKRDGAGQCIVFWFDMQLDEETAISNEPGSTTHWEQALQCLDRETPVRAGDTLLVNAEHDCH